MLFCRKRLIVRCDRVVRDFQGGFEGYGRRLFHNHVQPFFIGEFFHDVGHASSHALQNILTVAIDVSLQIVAQALGLALLALAARLKIRLAGGAQLALAGLELGLNIAQLALRLFERILANLVLRQHLVLRFLDFGGFRDGPLQVDDADFRLGEAYGLGDQTGGAQRKNGKNGRTHELKRLLFVPFILTAGWLGCARIVSITIQFTNTQRCSIMRAMKCAFRKLPWLLATITIAVAAPPEAAKKPKLVLAIAIDQFRYDYLLRFRKDYTSGFVRLLEHGAVFTNAHYIHAATVTAVGHSTFLSGATPSISGIIANEWYDRESGQTVTSVSDPKTKLVGGIAGQPGSSPQRLLVSTLGDEIKIQGNDSKVIGISIKDRSAILPAGHMADGAYWYANESNTWVTSTYYRNDLPGWATKINAEEPYKKMIGAKWLPYDAANESAKPFCTMVAGSDTRFCGSMEATPWGNEMIEEFAERAIDGENLGRHDGTDVLAVSFSSNDYVGHAVGPDDPSVRDLSIRTDRLLGKLFAYVDQRVGAGNTLIVLTADHGVAPVPEVNTERKMPGGRLSEPQLAQKMATALTKRFGPGKWLLPSPSTMPYLNLDLIHKNKLDPADVQRVAADAARSEQHIARVVTRDELEHGRVQQDSIGRAMTLGFYGPRSGDLYILQEPYYLFDATGTSHGTPYNYDTHVPIIFLGPGIKAGTYSREVAPNDIAPTLSALLGVTDPSGSVGRVLSEVLR